jgi:hypothetical protein
MELFFEKVENSAVHGKLPEAMQKLGEADFFAWIEFSSASKAQWYQRFMPTGAILKCMMRTEM